MAENDWIVAGINNPEFTVADFANFADLTTDNTQLLGVDDYINSDFIQNSPYFKDQAGNFDEDSFRNYYAARAQEFDQFAQDEFYRGPALDMFDLDRTPDTPVIDIQFNITRGYNPDRQKIGIEGVNIWSDPEFSQRELAKQNLVFNTEKGEFEDFTVNDHVLVSNPVEWLKSLWKDPLVLATWDEDGVHIDPVSGLPQEHFRGQPKLNEKGTYYYETLGKRSVLGKDVLSLFDTFTVDGQGLNKYDFFDSNDIKQSVGGVIMKNAVALLPMFIPSVAGIYSGVLLAKELTKTLPMLSGMITCLTGGDTPQWAETASAWAQRATMSMSDWSRQHAFSSEHFIGLVTDLAMLTGQQKFIADSIGALRGGQRYIAEAETKARELFAVKSAQYMPHHYNDLWKACLQKFMPQAEKMALKSGQLGRDLGLAYLALTFQHSTYEEMLEHGASKQAASAVALGAMVGMFSVDKWLHLGEIFYEDATGNTTKIARQIAKQEADSLLGKNGLFTKNAIFEPDSKTQIGLLRLIRSARDKATQFFGDYSSALKYHSLTAVGKMLGSGVERISETLCGDLSKGLYELAGKMGMDTSAKDVGAFENMGERYGMAFLAGVIGSGVFYGKEVLQRGTIQIPKLTESLVTLVRNGYADELREQVDRLERSGRLGNRKLSIKPVLNDEGNITGFITAKNGDMTQSGLVAKTIKDNITSIEAAINDSRTGLTDEQLFENAIMGNARLRAYENFMPATGYYEKVANLMAQYYKSYVEEKSSSMNPTGDAYVKTDDGQTVLAKDSPQVQNDEKRAQAQKQDDGGEAAAKKESYRTKKNDALAALNEFLSGDTSLRYTRMLTFGMDPDISDDFLSEAIHKSLDINKYCEDLYKKKMSELTPEELVELNKKYIEFRKNAITTELEDAFSKYLTLEEKTVPVIRDIENDAREYIKNCYELMDLMSDFSRDENGPRKFSDMLIDYDTMLPGEDLEDYAVRDTRYVDKERNYQEPEVEFQERKAERMEKVRQYNEAMEENIVQMITDKLDTAGWKIDPMTKRQIKSFLDEYARPKEIIREIVQDSNASEIVKEEMMKLNGNMKNEEDVINGLVDRLESAYKASGEATFRQWYGSFIGYDFKTKDGGLNDFIEFFGKFDEEDLKTSVSTLFDNIRSGNLREKSKEAVDGLTADSQADLMQLTESHIQEGIIPQFLNESFNEVFPLNLGELDVDMMYMYASGKYSNDYLPNSVEEAVNIDRNRAYSLADQVKKNKFIDLYNRLEVDVKNPVEELVEALAEKMGVKLSSGITKLLDEIWDDYDNIDNLAEFNIDSGKIKEIKSLRDIIKQAMVFMRVASTDPNTPNIDYPVGHNKFINEFAKTNASKLSKPWKPLPEIPADLAYLYDMLLKIADEELDSFVRMSEKFAVDKNAKVAATDRRLALMDYKTIDAINPDFVYNGVTYNLKKDFDKIGTGDLGKENARVVTFRFEQQLYNNIREIAEANGMTIVELFEKGSLIFNLVPELRADDVNDPEFINQQEFFNQNNVKVSENLEIDSTLYSKVMYMLTLLSMNPERYYADLESRLEKDSGIVPIQAQDIAGRMIEAMATGNFSRMNMSLYRSLVNVDLPILDRCLFVTGIAGTGKTFAVFGSFAKRFEGKNIYIVGPGQDVATRLAKNFGYSDTDAAEKSMTIKDLMKKLIGEERYAKLVKYTTAEDGKAANADDPKKDYETEFFKRTHNRHTKVPVYTLNEDAFKAEDWANKDEDVEAIFIDEAQKLSVVEAMIINKYLRDKNIYGYFAGDTKQDKFFDLRTFMGTIEPNSVYMARSPEMTLSLRNNNIQNYKNENAITSVMSRIQNDFNDSSMDGKEFKGKIGDYRNLAKSIRPQYYMDGKDINGLMLVDNLDEGTLAVLKKIRLRLDGSTESDPRKKRMYFIGKEDSKALEALRGAGIDVVVRDFKDVNGDECAYAIVDYTPERLEFALEDPTRLLDVLTKINTWITRATEGTVMIDNGISKVIGNSVKTSNKATSPKMTELIEEVRRKKGAVLAEIMKYVDKNALRKETSATTTDTTDETTDTDTTDETDETTTTAAGSGVSDTDSEKKAADALASKLDTKRAFSVDPEVATAGEVQGDDARNAEQKNISEALMNLHKIENQDSAVSITVGNRTGGETELMSTANLESVDEFQYETYKLVLLSVEDGGKVKIKNYGGEGDHDAEKWVIKRPKNGDLRNLQCFSGLNDCAKYSIKREYQDMLEMVQSIALDNPVDADEIAEFYSMLPQNFKDGVSKESWDNRKIAIEVRSAKGEIPCIGSPFGPDEMGIDTGRGGDRIYVNYVLLVKADRGKDSGRIYKIDLCGMNRPELFTENRDNLKEEYKKAADEFKAKGDNENMRRMEFLANNIDEAVVRYSNWFKRLLDKYYSPENRGKDGKPKELCYDVTDKAVKTLRTWLKNRSNSKPLRLSGEVDPNTVDTHEGTKSNLNNAKSRFTDMEFGEIIVVQDAKSSTSGLEPGIRNRVFVPVTGFKHRAKSDKSILEQYIEQRKAWMRALSDSNGKKMPPPSRIQLMPLDNKGLTIKQLLDKILNEKVTGEKDGMLPLNQNYTGAGMFVQLWNARAAVKEFNEIVKNWMDEHRLDEGSLNALTEIVDKRYYLTKDGTTTLDMSEKETEAMLAKAGLPTEKSTDRGESEKFNIIRDFIKLNNETLSKNHWFRLGSYLKRYEKTELGTPLRNYGFHIQRYKVDPDVFGTSEANMVAITRECALGFETMLDDFLNPLTSKKSSIFALTDEKGNLLDVKTVLDTKIEEAGTVKSIERMLGRISDGSINGVTYNNRDMFSIIPRMIIYLGKGTLWNKSSSKTLDYNFNKVKQSEEPGKSFDKVSFPIGSWLQQEADGKQGYNFLDMVTLLFHGTTDNPIREYSVDNKLIKADEARFKHGFFIEPGVTEKNRVYEFEITDPDGKRIKMVAKVVNTSGAYFDVTANPIGPAMRISDKNLRSIDLNHPETAEEILAKKDVPADASPDIVGASVLNLIKYMDETIKSHPGKYLTDEEGSVAMSLLDKAIAYGKVETVTPPTNELYDINSLDEFNVVHVHESSSIEKGKFRVGATYVPALYIDGKKVSNAYVNITRGKGEVPATQQTENNVVSDQPTGETGNKNRGRGRRRFGGGELPQNTSNPEDILEKKFMIAGKNVSVKEYVNDIFNDVEFNRRLDGPYSEGSDMIKIGNLKKELKKFSDIRTKEELDVWRQARNSDLSDEWLQIYNKISLYDMASENELLRTLFELNIC